MHYRESRERSAELLRIALPLMARQEAAFHPQSYALWYEHAAGLNPPLSRVLRERLGADEPLSDADVRELHVRHIVARDGEAFERVQARLRALLEETSRAASNAGAEAMQFGTTLNGHRSQLFNTLDVEAVREIVGELLTESARMSAVSAALVEQLDSSAREVRELSERLERAEVEAQVDVLTGLSNRRGFERAAAELGARSDAGLEGCCLLLIDIDEFKAVNDTHGHVFGDKVIRAVAGLINANIKGRDSAARLGGEEFGVLLPGTAIDGARALAEQIRTAVEHGRIVRADGAGTGAKVTLSIGIAAALAAEPLEALIARADVAMYASKHAGRNRVSVAGEAQVAAAGEAQAVAANEARAVAAGEAQAMAAGEAQAEPPTRV